MADTNGKTVLLVDDDKFLLDMYSLKFTQEGFVVSPCFSVREALDVLRGGLKPDVVLFDITMPGQDGFEFLKIVRDEKLAETARLIALTNQSNDADRKHAEELGAQKYVVKASMIPSEVVALVKNEIGVAAAK
jgi:two-component system chemotaxis response regulator CheY